jgi:hypothetical protein
MFRRRLSPFAISLARGGAILVLVLMIHGCGTISQLYYDGDTPDQEQAMLEKGHDAFQRRNYTQASEIFLTLSQQGHGEVVRRKALYGLACTRLISAEGAAEMNAAIVLWDTWAGLPQDRLEVEDPRFLRPVLDKTVALQNECALREQTPPPAPRPEGGAAEAERLNTLVHKLQSRVNKLEAENKTLKQQMSTLEAIDQSIQEKKKGIPLP